ncbi:hypothetical protein, partial [Sutterella wadsworthensis]|uniref:hypothetical protein n=1 Tax=Sutterella wadsworthensis TaxID=40545 RepID=UPI003AF45B0F
DDAFLRLDDRHFLHKETASVPLRDQTPFSLDLRAHVTGGFHLQTSGIPRSSPSDLEKRALI